MSSSSAERLSLSKRSSARTHSASGSESESSCSRNSNSYVVLETGANADSESASSASISSEQLQRKKRRKNVCDFSKGEVNLRRRALESGRCKKLELKMTEKVKLKEVVVQLVRLEDERRLREWQEQRQQRKLEQQQQSVAVGIQPKLEEISRDVEEPAKRSKKVEEEKVEDRLRLNGLTLPAEIDPKILQQQLVIKINKHQTEKFLQSKRRQLQITIDNSECVNKLSEKLTEGGSSDDSNKFTKNTNVSSSSSFRKVARNLVDKSNNDRLPDRLLKDGSKCIIDSVMPVERSVSENQPESSKSFVISCRRQKRSSIEQKNSDKQTVNLLDSRPKCAKEIGKRYPEGFAKDAKRYSKNFNKDVERQFGVVDVVDIKTNNYEKQQSELPCDKTEKVSKNVVVLENHGRTRRSLASKNSERHTNEPPENNQSDKLPVENEKLSGNMDKSILDSSKSQSDVHKKITRKIVKKHESHVESVFDSKADDGKQLEEEHNRKNSKRRDRKIECSNDETDNSKRIAKRTDDNDEISSGNVTESCVNYVANSVDAPVKLPDKVVKDVKVCIKNQIEDVIKNKKISNENVFENELNGTQKVTKEISNDELQYVHNNYHFFINSNEKIETFEEDSEEFAHIVDESSKKNSENSDTNINEISKTGVDNEKCNKINSNINYNENFVKNSTNTHFPDTPNIQEKDNKNDFHIGKEMQKVPEINQRPKRRSAAKTFGVSIEVATENCIDCKKYSVDKVNERLTTNLNSNVIECKTNLEIGTRRKNSLPEIKDDYSDTITEKNGDHAHQSQEMSNQGIPEKLNLEENTKLQTESIKRVKRKSILENAQNSLEENQKVLPDKSFNTLNICCENQTEQKIATKSLNSKLDQHIENSVTENIVLNNAVTISSNIDEVNCSLNDCTSVPPVRKRGRPKKVKQNPILGQVEADKKNNLHSHDGKITRKSQMVTRNSLLSKHEKSIEMETKNCSINNQKTIDKSKDRLKLPEESQEIVKVCSKSQTENQKRVTRKSSSDKHERQTENTSKQPECLQDNIDKIDEKISEKVQRKMKERLNIQDEGLLRVTRKSTLDSYERHPENLIANSLDITQNVSNECDQILSEKLDNKENSKNQIEINSKIIRCLPHKRDRQSKNLIENNVDSAQMIIDENRDKSSQNIINNINVFPSANKKLLKNSIDKSNETNTEFSVENDIISAHNIVEENIDNHCKSSENIIENNIDVNGISKHTQINIENNLPDSQHSTDVTSVKQLVCTGENNLDSINVMVYNESERQSEVDTNIKNCPNGLIDSKFPEIISEEILSRAERLINCKELVNKVVVDIEKEPKIASEYRAEESTRERYQDEIESIVQNRQELTNDYKSQPTDQDRISCAKIILEELFEMNTDSLERRTENSYEYTKNVSLETNEVPCENMNAQNRINVLDGTEEDNNAICSDDFDEVIKYFCIPANQKIKYNNECFNENPVVNISEANKCQALEHTITDSAELRTDTESHVNNLIIDECINISIKQEVCATKEIENDFTKSIDSVLTKDINGPSELQSKSPLKKIVNASSISLAKNNEEMSPMHKRKTTLLELRKKCTKNLELRESVSQENFTNGPSYRTLPIVQSGELESDKSSSSITDTSDENDGMESEEGNYPDSADSDENLADRLAQLRNLEFPPLNSSDDADSGVQTTSEEYKQQKRIGKIVLRCPRRSFMRMNAIIATAKLEFDCKDCDESFMSSRELKKHIKDQHRQRLVMKIRKTDENKHAVHIVEQPISKRIMKEQVDDEEDEGNASASPEKLDEDELVRSQEDERITEGDIKIIVRKEGGTKNSHVIKEIKITPKSNSDGSGSTRILGSSPARSDFGSGCSSSRIPGSSPARSDLGSSIGGGNSCRMPGNSPPRFDIVPITNPVKRGRGRPRKYPIFTEAELIAKHLGAPANPQVNNGAMNARKKKDDAPFIVEGIFGKRNEDEPLFEAVESIVIQPDFLFESSQTESSVINERRVDNQLKTENSTVEEAPSIQLSTSKKMAEIVGPTVQRKRGRTLSQESLVTTKAEIAVIVQDEKKRKVMNHSAEAENNEFKKEPKISQLPERSFSEPDLRAKYHITKELVVQLTKIDTVPKDNEVYGNDNQMSNDIVQIDACSQGETESSVPAEETPRRKTKPKILVNELVEIGSSNAPDLRAVIRLNLRRKLESNNNNLVVNNIDKCLTPTTSDSPKHLDNLVSTASASESNTMQEESVVEEIQAAPTTDEIQSLTQPELQSHLQPELQQQLQLELEMPARTSMSKNSCGDCNCEFHIDDDFDTFEDNQTLVSESEQNLIATPRPPFTVRADIDDNQKAKLHMLMNAPTPCESINNLVTTVDPTRISQPLQFQSVVQNQRQLKSQVQIQVQVQPPLPPLVHHQTPLQPHQMRPQVQVSPQAQIQVPSQVPLPPLTQIQTPPQAQTPQSQHSQLLQLQPATEGIQAQLQLPPQAQLVQLNQSQQFCILFFPESDGNNSAKDRPPTAAIVNFQPVPDNEIANKPLIFMPTTPTKISIDDHAKQYVCASCSQVLDIIGRLEASLGMTEEDKSAIKCPYCSNHFQSLFYLEYHMMQEHLKCENEKQCRHAGFSSLRIPTHEVASEFEIYITFALKCRSCYDIFNTVLHLNDHVMHKHKTLVRLKPPSLPFPNIPAVGPAFPSGSPFARKNGGPAHVAVLQCPSDCVCRIGIRSTDSPLQRQQMLKRCPNAMRRLEKIEPAAYEVYTCTLCKSTFLMKDEVVDHLMKMHEVSCKFPCYTCLTSFRSLQMQENHRCSETTLQDLDKLLSIAILPVNVSGSGKDDRSKCLEREDSSTDEYGAIKAAAATASNSTATSEDTHSQLTSNGYKRKNGETVAALQSFLTANAAKRAKVAAESMTTIQKASYRRRRVCPKCKLKFAARRALQEHVIYDHVLKGDASEGPRKIAIDLLRILTAGFADDQSTNEINDLLKGFSDDDSKAVKSLMVVEKDEQENWIKSNDKNFSNELHITHCGNCKTKITMPTESGNRVEENDQKPMPPAKLLLCEGCENGGPITRRRTIFNNGHHDISNIMTESEAHQLSIAHQYFCKKCPESFSSLMELKYHKRSTHNVICDICKKSFTSMRMLEKHKKTHRESSLDNSSKSTTEDDNRTNNQIINDCNKDNGEANNSLNDKTNSSSRRDSSDSSSGTSKEPEEQPLNCSFCEEVCSSKVSLKNHLKREHGRRASICQFCNGLLIDTSEVRHMLDYHIVPSKSTSRSILTKSNGTILHCEASCMQDDVEELVRTLGKHRLQSLMMYHDFEGKCNNAIMRCPMCPELFATRESCRFHYVWIHDDTCLLCDETFRSGSSAFQHKVDAHTSTASYLWCIQRLVTAIVYTLRLDPDQPSHVLYQMLAMRIENEEAAAFQAEQVAVRGTTGTAEKTGTAEQATDAERFGLEAVVLSEDQLPDSSNIIEVVIGKEDSEDDLLSMLNLSPSYESCSEQHRLPNAGTAPPEEEEDEETAAAAAVAAMAVSSMPTTPILSSTVASVATTPVGPTSVISPVLDNYVTSGVCKYRLENDEEQLVLVVTDDDLITFRDDIGSLAERISTTCDSLTLDEITEMLRAYFDSMNGVTNSGTSA